MNTAPRMVLLGIPTPDGEFTAAYSERGLCELRFPASRLARDSTSKATPSDVREWHALTTNAVRLTLVGRTPAELPPLDLREGTPFQQRVWGALRMIPTGSTRTYGDVARMIGKPGAFRAVGGACGANPIPVLVPCHRVLAAGNKLGGFSGGLNWKKLLLGREKGWMGEGTQAELAIKD